LERRAQAEGAAYAAVRAVTTPDQDNIWRVRKAGQGLLQGVKGDAKPIAFVEDTAVPPDRLAPYMRRFKALLDAHGVRAAFYAHASVGCLHVRPLINLKERRDIEKMKAIASAVGDLVVEFGGTMSGEHGDGLVRSWFVERFFGPQIYAAFQEVKRAFDPPGLLNPGKIVAASPIDGSLRFGTEYRTRPVPTYFDWSRDGGMAASVELCSGLGACRKTSEGTMCPSYMVTREEEHSTRGRANLLRAVLSGVLPPQDLVGRRLFEALDLCLECKACKTECPANVDMAKLKYEFLAHFNARHGVRWRARAFGSIAELSRIGCAMAPLSNWVSQSSVFRQTIQRALGIHPLRRLPLFARETLGQWLRKQRLNRSHPNVILFNDTFTNYNEPWIGRAALKLLENAGARVSVPDVVCCGRPMISKGLLDRARENARRNVALLAPFAEAGGWIVGCEPSCLLTLKDDYPDLLRTPESQRVARRSLLIEEYLDSQLAEGRWQPAFTAERKQVLLHGHCHQKSLVGTAPALRLLRRPPGFEVREVDSGCCGMAGSFGYETEHYALSLQIGELRLFPAVRQASSGTEIVAAGISCREQMPPGTMRPRSRARAAALLALVTLLLLCGCFHKKKAAAPPLPVTPARLVLLPPNVPHDNQDLRWVSLAATVLMAKELENAQDVEVIPLWESLPIALETLGASRSISGETPAYVASRLNARWATQGELSPSKHGVSLLIDFIPTKSTMFSYRYQNESPVESLHSALREALEQFLRYLQVRPLSQKTKGGAALEIKQLRQLAEAMDREYGWFEPAEPGKAQQTFASLARTDTRLARLLFKPSAYSDTGTRPASNSPAEGRVPTAVVAEVPPKTVAQPETRTQAPRSPDPAAKSEHPGAQIPRTPGAAPSETNASSQTP